MKSKLFAFAFVLTSIYSMAQTDSPQGIYYLEGVRETASGFKLDADSTFEFFFSQGALDRTGSGKWSIESDIITLNSPGKASNGFFIQKSEKTTKNKISVLVKEPNAMLLSFIYIRLKSNIETEFLKLGTDGSMELEAMDFSGIEFYFEICPERTYSFSPIHEGDNFFEFTIDPKIVDVHFENLLLHRDGKVLKGKHPLLRGETFDFVKSEQ
ncbi:MAG: hypothetical protein IPP71_02310 [Bacteroidetes bacterium]|nr:hypothetical protein [Bacteroidota bacterium]